MASTWISLLSKLPLFALQCTRYLNCRGDGGKRVPPSRLSVPPSGFRRSPIEILEQVYGRKKLLFLAGKTAYLKKPSDFGEDLFFFGDHLFLAGKTA